MIDHLSLRVTNLVRAKSFYLKALAPLGYTAVMEYPETVGLGEPGKPDLWLTQVPSTTPTHLAFAAPSRAAVDAFHREALAAGAKDDGAPGLRPQYHEHYYGAFVVDPDGHHIEAVIHRPE